MVARRTVLYTGEYRHNRDAKGRLTVPSKWRSGGEDEVEYLALPNMALKCITVYPPKRAEKLLEWVDSLDATDPKQQKALIKFSAMLKSFTYDSQGRISLDEKLLKFAGIEGKEVVLQGNVTSFTIWSKERYDDMVPEDLDEQSGNLSELLDEIGGF